MNASGPAGAAPGHVDGWSCVFCGARAAGDAEPVCAGCATERAENGYVFAPPGFGLDTCHGTNPARGCTDSSHAGGLPVNCWTRRP